LCLKNDAKCSIIRLTTKPSKGKREMKRLVAIILCLAMSFSLMGCDSKGNEKLPSGSDPTTDTDITPEQLDEILAEIEAGEAE